MKKWISVKDRLPETNDLQLIGYYVSIAPNLIIGLARHDVESQKWYGIDESIPLKIAYWAELPDMPVGEVVE